MNDVKEAQFNNSAAVLGKLFDALLANGAVQLPSKRVNSDFNHDPEAVKKAAKLDALYLRTLLAELTKPSVEAK